MQPVCIIINLGDSQLASGRSLNNKFAHFFATLTERQAQDEPFTGRRRRQKNWSPVLLHVEKEMNNEWLLILKKKLHTTYQGVLERIHMILVPALDHQ